jgi:hypothetical protein
LLDCGQDRLPFRDGLPDQERVHGGVQGSRILPGRRTGPVLGRDPVERLVGRSLAVVGHVDRGDREPAVGGEAAGASQDPGCFLVLPAAVSHQDQGTSAVGVFRRPQHAGDLAESEELFGDAVQRCLGDEAHEPILRHRGIALLAGG